MNNVPSPAAPAGRRPRKAVLPAGARATRLLPATEAVPKELLHLIDNPVIQYLIEEARDAGLTDALIINGRGKDAIANHFDEVRDGGDTKTKKSRRTLALAQLGVRALRRRREKQQAQRLRAGASWVDTGLVFTTSVGTALDAANVRRSFRRVIKRAGLDPDDWTPRELRHSFVSIMSAHGVSLEEIADLVGHAGTIVTEKVYRHQLRCCSRALWSWIGSSRSRPAAWAPGNKHQGTMPMRSHSLRGHARIAWW